MRKSALDLRVLALCPVVASGHFGLTLFKFYRNVQALQEQLFGPRVALRLNALAAKRLKLKLSVDCADSFTINRYSLNATCPPRRDSFRSTHWSRRNLLTSDFQCKFCVHFLLQHAPVNLRVSLITEVKK